ncbi:carbohydrate porin [Rhodoblastus acidophilus]|uniref:carbohydrate porin n=1 Tax=Rhodoblastus acidophilus TaxID=1074 RepID=UPI003CD02462
MGSGRQRFASSASRRFSVLRHFGPAGLAKAGKGGRWRLRLRPPRLRPTRPQDRGFYGDGGLTFQGMVPGRPDDQFALLGTFARISAIAHAADLDANYFTGANRAARTFESIIEVTYSFKVAMGVLVKPRIQ